MKYKTHIAFGIFVALLIHKVLYNTDLILFLIISIFASILPDIDSTNSKIGKKVKIIGLLFKHRGIFHSLFFAIILSVFIFLIFNKIYATGFFIGYVSHILLDATTKQGVRPFVPMFNIRINGYIVTGSMFETILFGCLILLDIFIFV